MWGEIGEYLKKTVSFSKKNSRPKGLQKTWRSGFAWLINTNEIKSAFPVDSDCSSLTRKDLTPSKLASRARVRMGHLPACFRHTESRTCDLVSTRLLEMDQKESWQASFRIVSSVFLDEETRPRHHPLRTTVKNPVKGTTTYRPRMLSTTPSLLPMRTTANRLPRPSTTVFHYVHQQWLRPYRHRSNARGTRRS